MDRASRGRHVSISRHSFGHGVQTMWTSHMYSLPLGSSMSIPSHQAQTQDPVNSSSIRSQCSLFSHRIIWSRPSQLAAICPRSLSQVWPVQDSGDRGGWAGPLGSGAHSLPGKLSCSPRHP